jgi:hypothetical protein
VHQDLVARLYGVSSEHVKDLGADPATKQYRPNEAETALRVEAKESVALTRYLPPKPGLKGDWVDAKGVVYDGCSPPESQFFDAQIQNKNFENQLASHLQNANVGKVVIDLTGLGLTSPQHAELETVIANVLKATGKTPDDLVRIP